MSVRGGLGKREHKYSIELSAYVYKYKSRPAACSNNNLKGLAPEGAIAGEGERSNHEGANEMGAGA